MTTQARSKGFTLIELLVVIAIIAIMGAILMPALSSATDRSRVTECRSNLTHIAIGLRMYFNDYGAYPDRLPALTEAGILTDDSMLLCTKTGSPYHYEQPTSTTAFDQTIASCVAADTPVGERPHSYRASYVALQKGGKITEPGR